MIRKDRIVSFAKPGNPGAKFKNTFEKMMKVLTLPKGAKEELNYGLEIAEKIMNGEALWDEDINKEHDSEINEDGDENA